MHMISTLLAAALTLTPGTTEIVVDKAAPKATLIAANEMQGLLGKVLGGEVPIVREPAPRRVPHPRKGWTHLHRGLRLDPERSGERQLPR